MDAIIVKTKYEDLQDVINMAQIKLQRVAKLHQAQENQEAMQCLTGAVTWINQILLIMEEK